MVTYMVAVKKHSVVLLAISIGRDEDMADGDVDSVERLASSGRKVPDARLDTD